MRRHNRCISAIVGEPRSSFYFAMEPSTNLVYDLVSLRERIDDLRVVDVVWDSLRDVRGQYPFQRCAFYNGPIVCFEIVELYLPQRFLRQLGFVQPIPTTPFAIEPKKLKSSVKSYKAAYSNLGDFSWSEWRNHLLHENLTTNHVGEPWDCDSNYMEWYKSVSHPFVANPNSRITEPIQSSEHNSLVKRMVSLYVITTFFYSVCLLLMRIRVLLETKTSFPCRLYKILHT